MRNITRTSSRTKPSTLPSAAPTRNSGTNSAVCKAKDQPKLTVACLRMPKKSNNIARSTQALSTPDTSPAAAMSRKGHDPNCSSTKTIGRKRVQSLDYEIRTPTMRSSLDFNYSCSSNSSSLSVDETSMPITPAMFCSGIVDQDDIPECSGDSLLEALPFDVLVCILCGLNHDELKPLFHVCKRLRKAVESAMQSHFNFTTPYQRRQRMLQFSTPRPLKCRSFSRQEENDGWQCVPATPRAPKQVSRTTHPHCNSLDLKNIAMALFQAPTIERSHLKLACIPRLRSRRHISHRALFAQLNLFP